MSINNNPFVSYGFSQPLINDAPVPIVAQRAPTTNDRAQLGTIWLDQPNDAAYVLVSIINNSAMWIALGGAGGSLTFDADVGSAVPSGNVIDIVGGSNINTGAGTNVVTVNLNDTVSISGSFTAGTTAGFITAQTGDITATAGNINLPNTDAGGAEGIINFGGTRFINNIGVDNTFVGADSGNLATTGLGSNVGIGARSLNALTTGSENVAVGLSSLEAATTAIGNVAIGSFAGQSLTDGTANVIIGRVAAPLANCESSVIIGHGAMGNYTGTGTNVAIGAGALAELDTGTNNICIGTDAGMGLDTTESNNILIGTPGLITDNNTIRIGVDGSGSLEQDTCFIAGIIGNAVSNEQFVTIDSVTGQLGVSSGGAGDLSTLTGDTGGAVSAAAGNINILGGSNINTVGTANTVTVNLDNDVTISGTYTTTGGNIIIPFADTVGSEGLIITGSGTANLIYANNGSALGVNVFIADAGNVTPSDTSLGANIGIGSSALSSIADGWGNIALGRQSMQDEVSGIENICIGIQSGQNMTNGTNSIAIGTQSGRAINGAVNCIFIGNQAGLGHGQGSSNIGIGDTTLVVFDHPTDGNNIAIGSNGVLAELTEGNFNIAIGATALNQVQTGICNTCIGSNAGENYVSAESNNIIIGMQGGTVSEDAVIRIGNVSGTAPGVVDTTACFIGGISGVTVTGSAVLCAADGQLGTVPSSERYKENIQDLGHKSKDILSLRPVIFNYKQDESKAFHFGLIAEEVHEVLPELVLYNKEGVIETVAYHELPVLLLNELMKSNKRIEELERKLEEIT